MEAKDKELLLKDLCTRLPYGVKCSAEDSIIGILSGKANEVSWVILTKENKYEAVKNIKPYLRPMSSMTEEEKAQMKKLWFDNNRVIFLDPKEIRCYRFYDSNVVDWLNAHHFDYRGLIEKGLAIAVTEESSCN